jgi:hypothetical protein
MSLNSKIPTWRAMLQYWAYNMSRLLARQISWPGFGYTTEEKKQLAIIAEGLPKWKYRVFLLLNSILFILVAASIVFGTVLPSAIILDPNHTSGLIFLGCLAVGTALSIGFGLPITMNLSALILNAITKPHEQGLLNEDQAILLYRKMTKQLNRIGIILGIILIPLVVFGATKIGGQIVILVQLAIRIIVPSILICALFRSLAPKPPKTS